MQGYPESYPWKHKSRYDLLECVHFRNPKVQVRNPLRARKKKECPVNSLFYFHNFNWYLVLLVIEQGLSLLSFAVSFLIVVLVLTIFTGILVVIPGSALQEFFQVIGDKIIKINCRV